MKNLKASYEARLKNSKELISAIRKLSLYSPTAEDIKKDAYASFYDEAELEVTAYRDAFSDHSFAVRDNNLAFDELKTTAISLRNEIGEQHGTDSGIWNEVNTIVKLITGANLFAHRRNMNVIKKGLKEGEEEPGFNSVSRQDKKSVLGNYRLLVSLIRNFDGYRTDDPALKTEALEALEVRVTDSLQNAADKRDILASARSTMSKRFDAKKGLKDKAKRAKMHVARRYGRSSSEYKTLVNKKY